MSRKVFALLAALLVGVAAAGIAIAGKDTGNDKNFEYAIASGATCRTRTSRRRSACRT